ncbi:hypothetical protein DAPPUDRAFT_245801 [Daphnia pulex]|uniref:Uncharacterized protein n=1 Tax=Daphnia pulex TaxID=6669 RepID=E9GP35_DAPPU|nr:hypothetical protein DAPPUDRAFT_245801 [Daphnia pulex]|eukprot:EFX78573.1 hypothetical protein DAPPUDRAFT_245801 [Daphnia pulex]
MTLQVDSLNQTLLKIWTIINLMASLLHLQKCNALQRVMDIQATTIQAITLQACGLNVLDVQAHV